MAKDFSTLEDSNASTNPHLLELSAPSRRQVLQGGLAAAVSGLLAACAQAPSGASRLGFRGVPLSEADTLTVPEGYEAQVLQPWGDPVGLPGHMPAFRWDARNSAAEQAAQMGMHHDGMAYFPLDGSRRGLLVINHEYADLGLLFPEGAQAVGSDAVAKGQAAHGFSVTEIVRQADGRWVPVLPSPFARRITASTPHAVGGPAAGHPLLRTAADPAGQRILGTLADCAAAATPWGSYVAGEENFIGYFRGPQQPNAHERRWGLRAGEGWGYRWAEHDERFDAALHPNEPNRFGWVVEFDPFDPTSVPVKRTALGRAAHEGATVTLTREGRAVVYSGEDARFEYLYKFVSRDRMQAGGFKANATLLDHGTLYVARFDADGGGRWLPLVHGQGGLTAANGFADQGEVLVKARQASDHLGGTPMDRPEWIAVDPQRNVYCTLTNNSQRGAPGKPGVDAANPRSDNVAGHIIRWQEAGDFDAETFRWTHFVLAGDPRAERAEVRGTVRGDAFACPDGLFADPQGRLWIGTDMSSTEMGPGVRHLQASGNPQHRSELAALGNNALLCADPQSGDVRRFLVGPVGCEITGPCMTPDGRTLFVNVQHPGEAPGDQSDPKHPRLFSNWPDHRADGRPRSATVAIRKRDGGVIGS